MPVEEQRIGRQCDGNVASHGDSVVVPVSTDTEGGFGRPIKGEAASTGNTVCIITLHPYAYLRIYGQINNASSNERAIGSIHGPSCSVERRNLEGIHRCRAPVASQLAS